MAENAFCGNILNFESNFEYFSCLISQLEQQLFFVDLGTWNIGTGELCVTKKTTMSYYYYFWIASISSHFCMCLNRRRELMFMRWYPFSDFLLKSEKQQTKASNNARWYWIWMLHAFQFNSWWMEIAKISLNEHLSHYYYPQQHYQIESMIKINLNVPNM